MTQDRVAATPFGGVALLERAISYTLGTLHDVTPVALSRSTPCREWDLSGLLAHMNDSLVALQEAADLGHVGLAPVTDHAGPALDLVASLRDRACWLLGAWARTDDDTVSVGGCPVATDIVACAGAVEIATHGWDVAKACGRPRPIPPQLAAELLLLSPLLVTDSDRPAQFAPPVAVAPEASQGDRLIAFLGRTPG